MKFPICLNCDYDLYGLAEETHYCPECGAAVELQPISVPARPNHRLSFPWTIAVIVGMSLLCFGSVYAAYADISVRVLFALLSVLLVGMTGVMIWFESRRILKPNLWIYHLRIEEEGIRVACDDPNDEFTGFWPWCHVDDVIHKPLQGAQNVQVKSNHWPFDKYVEIQCNENMARLIVRDVNRYRDALRRAKKKLRR